MRVIFLDIDGVLNNQGCYRHGNCHPEFGRNPDPACVEEVNRISRETGAVVVVSSTWRAILGYQLLQACLTHWGVSAPLIGTTPILRTMSGDICLSQPRGIEIQAWLNAHPEVTSFVILDDDSDMAHLTPRLVQTTFKRGLTKALADKAIEALAEGKGTEVVVKVPAEKEHVDE